MKRFLHVLLISSVLLTALVLPVSAKPNKVVICHKGKTISVSSASLNSHLAHGDYVGPCDSDSE